MTTNRPSRRTPLHEQLWHRVRSRLGRGAANAPQTEADAQATPDAPSAIVGQAMRDAQEIQQENAAPIGKAEHCAAPSPAGEAPACEKGVGPLTSRRLDELDSLVLPFVRDPFYRLRPPFTQEGMELSLELAQMTYTLDLDPWLEAGWTDFSIQIDNTLQSGLTLGESATGERMREVMSAWRVHRAKAALGARNPISQIIGALRQREKSDTIKAVCMMHPLSQGRYLLAIGFMGTGKRLYDWVSNFRFTTEEGFHKGFHQLCTYFEQGAESIVFPSAAQELGLEKLTLGEALSEMRSPRSRFRLWMAGHSQGGAVMQVFTHRLMTDWGVLPQNIVGYGFASPTVATGSFIYDPASYPLYHILNSDDMVPRMGALIHLGLCALYPADDALRRATYGLSALPADVSVYEALRPYRDAMTNTGSIFLYGAAFVRALAEEKGEEGLAALMDKRWSVSLVDKALAFAGDKAAGWVDALLRQVNEAYEDLLGKPMNPQKLDALCDQMRPLVRKTPLRRLLGGLASYTVPPHHLSGENGEGAYSYIVKYGADALAPFIWVKQNGAPPVKHFAQADSGLLRGADASVPTVRRRERKPSQRRAQPMGVRRVARGR